MPPLHPAVQTHGGNGITEEQRKWPGSLVAARACRIAPSPVRSSSTSSVRTPFGLPKLSTDSSCELAVVASRAGGWWALAQLGNPLAAAGAGTVRGPVSGRLWPRVARQLWPASAERMTRKAGRGPRSPGERSARVIKPEPLGGVGMFALCLRRFVYLIVESLRRGWQAAEGRVGLLIVSFFPFDRLDRLAGSWLCKKESSQGGIPAGSGRPPYFPEYDRPGLLLWLTLVRYEEFLKPGGR